MFGCICDGRRNKGFEVLDTPICYLSDSLPYLNCLGFLVDKNDILSLCEDLVRSI